ncbi:MAG: hypothetical protein JRN29_05225 [Nitrososphaerota archaeon]|nr:hypothetical protein [Nitrososphaerota archaeon]
MSLRDRLSDNFHEAYVRDRRFVEGLDTARLDRFLWPLYVGFICLNFMDVYSTFLALSRGPYFQELNPIAAALFELQLPGLLLALAFKYLPAIPLFYIVFVRDRTGTRHFEIALVKFSALVALVSADIFLLYIVASNNIPLLMTWALHAA